jgi:Domain of unknown function (DUF4406)
MTNALDLYIAGPMRGYANHNFPAFHEAAKKWERNSAIGRIYNPAKMDEDEGFIGTCMSLDGREHLKACMERDVAAVLKSDAMLMLRGWEKSDGARVEHALAVYLGLAIFYES